MAKSISAILNLKDNFSKTLEKTTANTKKFQREMKQVTNTAKDMQKAILSSVGKITAGLAIGNFAKNSIMLASDLQEVQNVVDTTFGDSANKIDEFAKSALQNFGITELQAKKFNGTLGALMKSSGVTSDKLLDMSTSLTGLSADFASFYNLEPEEAFEKIKSGISGETEPLKALGINMSVTNLNAYALAQGLGKTYDKMTQGEQTLLRYNYLMSVSGDAQGDFAKTSDSFANQLTILSSTFQQLGANLAKFVLPPLNKGLIKITEFSGKMNSFIESFDATGVMDKFNIALTFVKDNLDKIIMVVGTVAPMLTFIKLFSPMKDTINLFGGALGTTALKAISFKNILLLFKSIPALILSPFNLLKSGFIALLNPIGLLKNGFALLKVGLSALFSPFNLIIVAIGLLVAGVMYCWKTNSVFRENMINAWNSIKESVMTVVNIIISWLQQLQAFYVSHKAQIDGIISAIFNGVGSVVSSIVTLITGLMSIISNVFQAIDGIIHGNWNQTWEACKNIVSTAIDTIKQLWQNLKDFLSSPIKAVVNIFKKEDTSVTGDNIDKNATGTNYFRGGYTWVGEHGRELLKLPSGTQIKSNSQSQNMVNDSNSNPQINITVQGNVIGNHEFVNEMGSIITSKLKLALAN